MTIDARVENPAIGVYIYKNALKKDMKLVERLEKVIEENSGHWFKWSEAQVGDYQTMKDYRDCVDFKVGKLDTQRPEVANTDMASIYNEIDERLQECLKDYCAKFNISMEYQEAVNFVRYGKGQHFAAHSDHGFSYVCTVSSVMYLNDNYAGGELHFPFLDYTYTPEEGDIVLFPSTFLYLHAALPVEEGIKYAAVTMFDWNSRFHGSNSTLKTQPTS
jgi:predicted 2-oxoglutarate/Fe(II)-dependent dioxygenase YbiX